MLVAGLFVKRLESSNIRAASWGRSNFIEKVGKVRLAAPLAVVLCRPLQVWAVAAAIRPQKFYGLTIFFKVWWHFTKLQVRDYLTGFMFQNIKINQ
jgi:hypothetical protein